MLVDDRVALIGSANLNDRSLLGSRDSEIAAVIQDERYVLGAMDGRPWRAGRFTQSLRMALWAEHLGLKEADVSARFLLVSRSAGLLNSQPCGTL